MSKLTDLQAAFVHHYTTTPGCIGNAAASARAAGYSESTAKEQGHRVLNLPHVREAILEGSKAQVGSLTSLAVERLRQILSDDEAPPKLWLDASKTVLDRAGLIAPKAMDPNEFNELKAERFEDLPPEELQRRIVAARVALAEAQSGGSLHLAIDNA
jgi:hypothetical protein